MAYELLPYGVKLIWNSEKIFFLPEDLFLSSKNVMVAGGSKDTVDLLFQVKHEGKEGEMTVPTPLTREKARKMLHEYLDIPKRSCDHTYELLSKGVRIYPRESSSPGSGGVILPYHFFNQNPKIEPHPDKKTSCFLLGNVSGMVEIPLRPEISQEMLTAVYNRLI